MAGQQKFRLMWRNAIWQFESRENMEGFERNPHAFAPQYGGYCAFGLANGFKFDGDPDVWRIVDDRLYLNLSPAVSEIWQKDIPGYIETAGTLWTEVKDADPADLNP